MYTCNQGKGWRMGHCYVAITILHCLSLSNSTALCSADHLQGQRSQGHVVYARNSQVCSLVSGDILETHEPSITYAMVQ